jgi:hypothetical protein
MLPRQWEGKLQVV